MNRFIARQPIFNLRKEVVAYELLFRDGLTNCFSGIDGNEATRQVLLNTFVLFGINRLTAGKPAFINFPRDLLLTDMVKLFPPQAVVIELLEDVLPEPEVIKACADLGELGYTLALDDVVDLKQRGALVNHAKLVKVDFMASTQEQRAAIVEAALHSGVQLLAEKVETLDEFERAAAAGYTMFQGYFFAKPEILRKRDIPANRAQHLRLIRELHSREVVIDRLETIIKQEMSLSYRLLRYINSPVYGLRSEVKSIRHALTLLGERDVRRWALLAAISSTASDKPAELLQTGLQRARICEVLASAAGFRDRDAADELFLTGLFSVIDALLDAPLTDVLEDVSVPVRAAAALRGQAGPFRTVLEVALAYEKGDWECLAQNSENLAIAPDALTEVFVDAVDWAQQATQSQATPVWATIPPLPQTL